MQTLDAVVIGGGPAGLSAALYLARAGCAVRLLEQSYYGGNMCLTGEISNVPGVLPCTGIVLSRKMQQQAIEAGASLHTETVSQLRPTPGGVSITTDAGQYLARGAIVCTGSRAKPAGFEGETLYTGRGVSTCAVCDGALYRDREVFTVGSGLSAVQESLHLSTLCRQVTMLIRGGQLHASPALRRALALRENIQVCYYTRLESVGGAERITTLTTRQLQTGETRVYTAPPDGYYGVFVFVGYTPRSELVRGLVACDAEGYLQADVHMRLSVPGLYAAGDVCRKPLRQVVTATADGAVAAMSLVSDLS